MTHPQATTLPEGPYEQAITHVVGIVIACSYIKKKKNQGDSMNV